MSQSLNKIDMLEKRVNKVLEIIRTLQEENASLREENGLLKAEKEESAGKAEDMEKDFAQMKEKYDEVMQSQEKVRDRIEGMLENLGQIEKKISGPAAEEEGEIKAGEETAEKDAVTEETEEVRIDPFAPDEEEAPDSGETDDSGADEEKSLF